MRKLTASVLITDLDNTLFDWFEQWYQSFTALLQKVEEISGIDRKNLLPEIQAVFRHHGTSEYAFLLQELPSLRVLHPKQNILDIYDEAIHAYRKARKETLQLYPTVSETLSALRTKGVRVVAYTESLHFYARHRLITLGLDGLIEYLYCPPDHDLPDDLSKEDVRTLPRDAYQFRKTEQRLLPAGELKPNPKLLLDIVADIHACRSDCVYVGDSLAKDISMAQHAGILDAYASYGVVHTQDGYELLRAVTHWTEEQVTRERQLPETQVRPTIRLYQFSDLLTHVDFEAF